MPLAQAHDGRPEAGTTGLTGRPRALSAEDAARARRLRATTGVAEIAAALGVSRATVYRYLAEQG